MLKMAFKKLQKAVEDTIRHRENSKSNFTPYKQWDYKKHIAAQVVITQMLGHKWWQKYAKQVMVTFQEVVSPDKYRELILDSSLPPIIVAPDRFVRHISRVVYFAELLFNLQVFPGFCVVIEKLKCELDGADSIIAELEAAMLLWRNAYFLEFVKAKSIKKGDDFDIIATLGRTHVYCEVKCKISSTDLSVKTIENALKVARRQLPSNGPSIVFMRVPETWIVQVENTIDYIEVAFGNLSQMSKRISSVVIYGDFVMSNQITGLIGHHIHVKVVHNQNARHSLSHLGKMIELPGKNKDWISLQNI